MQNPAYLDMLHPEKPGTGRSGFVNSSLTLVPGCRYPGQSRSSRGVLYPDEDPCPGPGFLLNRCLQRLDGIIARLPGHLRAGNENDPPV